MDECLIPSRNQARTALQRSSLRRRCRMIQASRSLLASRQIRTDKLGSAAAVGDGLNSAEKSEVAAEEVEGDGDCRAGGCQEHDRYDLGPEAPGAGISLDEGVEHPDGPLLEPCPARLLALCLVFLVFRGHTRFPR